MLKVEDFITEGELLFKPIYYEIQIEDSGQISDESDQTDFTITSESVKDQNISINPTTNINQIKPSKPKIL